MARNYSDLVQFATRMAERELCPMCSAFHSFKTLGAPSDLPVRGMPEPASTLSLVCGECGYVRLFLITYLERYAAKAESGQNGH